VAKAVLIGSVTSLMLKTAANPFGLPIDVFDQIRTTFSVIAAEILRDYFISRTNHDAHLSVSVVEGAYLASVSLVFSTAVLSEKTSIRLNFII